MSAIGLPAPGERRLERFARQEAGPLYTLFRRALGDDDMARDLLQDTYVAAWRNLASYDDSRPFRNWIFRIGQNRLRNLLRRRAVEGKALPTLTEDRENETPEALAIRRERQERLEAALLKLPHRQRIIVLLRYQEGLTCADIGRLISLTPNAVSIQLHRARRHLKDDLENKAAGGAS